jgi:hypothetical protein
MSKYVQVDNDGCVPLVLLILALVCFAHGHWILGVLLVLVIL